MKITVTMELTQENLSKLRAKNAVLDRCARTEKLDVLLLATQIVCLVEHWRMVGEN